MATLEKEQWLRWVDRVLNVLCALIGCVVVYLLLSVFCFCTFKVPSESMMPDLLPGDQVVVNKMVLGPQLFNLRQAAKRRRVPVYRLPGFGEVRRNDVLVFHDPYPYGSVNRIRMDRRNAAIYRELIEWEQQGSLRVDSAGVVSLDDKPLEGYRFGHDYYFMAGDNVPASHDSRFWGLLPDEFIVGKVWLTFHP